MSAPSKPRISAARPSKPMLARDRAPAKVPAEHAAARTVVLTETDAASVATIVAALPAPAELAAGTLVVVPGRIAGKSLARSVLSMLGRPKLVARAERCTALVVRGYVAVGAAEHGDDDLAWGYVPARP